MLVRDDVAPVVDEPAGSARVRVGAVGYLDEDDGFVGPQPEGSGGVDGLPVEPVGVTLGRRLIRGGVANAAVVVGVRTVIVVGVRLGVCLWESGVPAVGSGCVSVRTVLEVSAEPVSALPAPLMDSRREAIPRITAPRHLNSSWQYDFFIQSES